jgi:hypothetical protein
VPITSDIIDEALAGHSDLLSWATEKSDALDPLYGKFNLAARQVGVDKSFAMALSAVGSPGLGHTTLETNLFKLLGY